MYNPNKWGIKFWALCDGQTSYMSKLMPYQGRLDKNDLQKEHGLGYRFVHDLTMDLVHRGHHIYFDRFFTGIPLMTKLLFDGI